MTKAQITTILADLGYKANEMVNLEKVSSIYTNADHCLYPDEETRFLFNTSDGEILEVYHGTTKDGKFVADAEFANYYISFSVIAGFTLVSPTHIKQPFRLGQAV